LRAERRLADAHHLEAYKWMAGQMRSRLGCRPTPDCLPLWCWSQWSGQKRARPDLRAVAWQWRRGERAVRIEFEMNDDSVLLSDFELWHYVLNYWYLPSSHADGDAFEAELEDQGLSFYKSKPVLDSRYHRRIVQSWERIFDLDWQAKGIAWPRSKKAVQATIWELPLDSVTSVTEFSGRSRPS